MSAGKSSSSISRVGRSEKSPKRREERSTVNRIVRAFQSCRRIKDALRKPRSRVTTEQEDAWIVAAAAVKPGLSAQQIKNTLDLRASVTMVKRRLREAGLKSRIAAQKPLLRAQNKEKRLQFSRQHAQRSTEEWKQVVFTDECTFTTSCDQQARIWSPDNTRYQAKFLQRVSKSGRSTAHRELAKVHFSGAGPVFQHDRSPMHTSKKVEALLRQLNIAVLEWPPQSPDFNITANIWGQMKAALASKPLHEMSKDSLWRAVHAEWERLKLDATLVDSLYSSLPRRMAAAIASGGDATRC
ncbi:hypothetical protein HPB50_007556 [Hyalomma asiaticum]|uniref:Uncharacterized protein n=1 Tax=Hyalomma asiaticum TaxID=266040 RepID=A0ACB7TG27_HYAAI|nr:hypothetical protein HPB50_007556 [Hyalomma asiaticum]